MINKIHFFNLQDSEDTTKSICKIIKKYYKQNLKIAVNTEKKDLLEIIDERLWTFEQTSFVPHCRYDEIDESCNVVLFNGEVMKLSEFDVILNLTNNYLDDTGDDKIYIELVTSDEEQKQLARKKYKHYQKMDIDILYENL